MSPNFNSTMSHSFGSGAMNVTRFDDTKRGLSCQPESLFSMALYDFESMGQQTQRHFLPQVIQSISTSAPSFHPVDEYKDLSLKELLDLSDDFLFGDEEQGNESSMFNPLPFVPRAPHAAESRVNPSMASAPSNHLMTSLSNVYAEPVGSMRSLGIDIDAAEIEPTPILESPVPISPSSSCFVSGSLKRQREELDDEDEDDDELNTDGRFRPYQAGQWSDRFSDLCVYRERMGNCLVPHTYKDNLPLARWVKRQRYQYKLMIEGKPSTMTPERVKALEDIGFVWDSQGAAWGERLEELKVFRNAFLHSNVPSNYSENPQLATWVKCQRRQYKLYMEGKPSNMTPQRIRELEDVGFEWLLRSYKKHRTH